MTKIQKKKVKILLILIVFLTLGFSLLNWWGKNYIEDSLAQNMPHNFTLKYSDLNINILRGSAVLLHTTLNIKDKDSLANHTALKLETIELSGVSYWDLLFNETLSIENINLKKPELTYYPSNKIPTDTSETKTNERGIKTIQFNELKITDGSINVMKKGSDSIKTSIQSYNFKIRKSKINLNSINQKYFDFESYDFKANEIILANNTYETIKIEQLNSTKDVWDVKNLQIIPKYSKTELSKHLTKERDYINLSIPKVRLNHLDFIFNDDLLDVSVTTAEIINPNLEVYRDKLVADDLTIKNLYSKSLRELNFNLAIDTTKIKNGYISYAELVESDNKAGKLFFNKIDATINHLTNKKNAKETEIKTHAELMGKAPLELNWSFDVNNISDAFEVSGSLNNLYAEILNPFLKPNLNALAEGTLQQMYFTFYGNSTESEGEIKMKYDDFEFKILRQNSSKINEVLTAIGNIFISDKSKTNAEVYRYGDIKAERNTTKSFFNYLWINVKSGLVSTLTGNGKK